MIIRHKPKEDFMMKNHGFFIVAALLAVFFPTLASAHITTEPHNHFMAGFAHPIFGLDHLLAMLSVGIVSTQMKHTYAVLTLPIAFVSVMVVGGLIGMSGLFIGGIETGIVLSVLLLGASIFFGGKLPASVIYTLVAFFALFHGYVHGAEMPERTQALPFVLGFTAAAIIIHLAGVAIGLSAARAPGRPHYIRTVFPPASRWME